MQVSIAGAWFDVVGGLPDVEAAFPNSVATQNAINSELASLAALSQMSISEWVEANQVEESSQPPTPPNPSWSDFRLALMVNSTFRAWAATLPADWREDLKTCAILCNVEALQTTYNHLASIYPPDQAAAAEWQQIADANHIPTTF